ncbi:MAG: ABC transporter substrate-binding protein [Candidatus Thorarchaeota archaeon]
MKMEKKDIIIIILSFCLLFTSITGILLSIQHSIIEVTPPEIETLVVGTGSGPHDLDPTDSWDAASNDVIEQVVETLFTYDTRHFVVDETMPRINWLATGYSWDVSNTILTVGIRTGVRFHDGTLMDADSIAWNFNRFMYLMNHTGELPADGRPVKVHSLYEFPDGEPIFESVIAFDGDTVIFTLTAPYAPILDAMCYISCGILSPVSTPATEIIDIGTGDIVGTGPYMYDYYITDTEVRFTRFDDYWATAAPYNLEDEVMFDAMVYNVIDDPTLLNYAMLAGDIDILFGAMTDLLPAYRTNPWIKVYEAPKPGLVYQYLAFNIHQINVTWRKAMSYAINYTYIIEELLEGRAFRAYGAISPGYGAGFNHWLRDSPQTASGNGSGVYNLAIARQVIINGLGGDARLSGLTVNSDPNDTAWEAADFVSFNYSYNTDNWFRSNLFPLLKDWFDDIGITVIDGGYDWWYWYYKYSYVPGQYDQLQLYFISWSPDHMDPFNILNPLFSNISVSNACQINDPWIMGNLSLALQTTDDATRNKIYWDIQWRLFAELYVHAPIYHLLITSVHSANLYDVGYNVMGRWWALSVKRNHTWVPEI